jgi:hypothetical protein
MTPLPDRGCYFRHIARMLGIPARFLYHLSEDSDEKQTARTRGEFDEQKYDPGTTRKWSGVQILGPSGPMTG